MNDYNNKRIEKLKAQIDLQKIIRRKTLKNYSSQCALCDVKDPGTLDAGHIKQWSKDVLHRGLLKNVICLCRFHHRLFDLKRITVLEDNTVKFSSRFERECQNSKVYDAIKKLTEPRLRMPIGNHPDPEFLHYHNKEFYDIESRYG